MLQYNRNKQYLQEISLKFGFIKLYGNLYLNLRGHTTM